MSFISYAQNYEDVMLWRALKHVKNGFYIDVGAAWPEKHSVTKAFYDMGWRGINIEPNPALFTSLSNQRGRDINLQVAVGESDVEVMINYIDGTGLSTLNNSVAILHKLNGHNVISAMINTQSLSRICLSNVPFGQEIHFLKIDIEGSEKQALLSHDWETYRPWIVLVEATSPMSQQESFEEWEPILLGVDYVFSYADGLNRFYVAKEQSYLINSFKYPPNIFDDFSTIEKIHAEAMAQQAEIISNTYLVQLDAIYRSKSWRITTPLRWMMSQLRLLHAYSFKNRVKMALKKVLVKVLQWILANPKIKSVATQIAWKLKVMRLSKTYLRKLLENHHEPNQLTQSHLVNEQLDSPRGKYIYEALKSGVKKYKNET